MDISLQDINSVDKEVIITADREDLEPKFQEAYKKYKKQINMPGFRPGKVPVEIVRKRFGDEIEQEEVGNYVQEVFENEVVPEYEPVGEPEMLDLTWEDDKLEAKFKVGLRPEFELADLEDATVDLMVHDVTDEEVEHELEHALEREGNWEEVEEPVTENSKVTVDAVHLDEDGEPIEGETDEDQVIDLRQDEFAKEQSNDEAKNVDEYKSLLKSRIQDYYDQSADDLFKNEIVDTLVEKHDFEVPESFLEQVLDQYVQRVEQQAGGDLPDDFDREAYKEQVHDRAVRDAKWYFINEKLQEKFDDIEIESDDVDEHLAAQAAQYGVTVDQMRNMFAQNPQQLENLRNSIREEKVFDRLKDIVNINEMDKETYEQKHEEVNS